MNPVDVNLGHQIATLDARLLADKCKDLDEFKEKLGH